MARRTNSKGNYNKQAKKGKEAESKIESGIEQKPGYDRDKDETSTGDPSKEAVKDTKKNDPSWYSNDPQLLLDAASIPFSEAFGSQVCQVEHGIKTMGDKQVQITKGTNSTIPGIGVLSVRPSYGYSVDRNSPINVAAQMLYTHVRYNNSGRKNYDQTDLMLYMMALSEIYSFVFWMKRIYASAFMFSQRNFYVGKALLAAQDVDPDDIARNLAAFRSRLNIYINKVSAFVIPSNIELFKRRAFMYSGLYTESETGNLKDQLYMFRPEGFHKFTVDATYGGCLKYIKANAGNSPLTADQLFELGDSLLDNITGDEDFGIMSGDLLRAFGSNLLGISSQEDEAALVPMFDAYVLAQFKNASLHHMDAPQSHTFIHQYDDTNTMTVPYSDVYQDPKGNLVCKDVATYRVRKSAVMSPELMAKAFNGWRDNLVIACPTPEVDPAYIVEATRLTAPRMGSVRAWGDGTGDYEMAYDIDGCSDIAAEFFMYYYSVLPTDGSKVLTALSIDYQGVYSSVGAVEPSALDRVLGSFKWAPIFSDINITENKDGSYKVNNVTLLSDVWNYTVQSPDVIHRLNEVALMSLAFVPGVAKIMS